MSVDGLLGRFREATGALRLRPRRLGGVFLSAAHLPVTAARLSAPRSLVAICQPDKAEAALVRPCFLLPMVLDCPGTFRMAEAEARQRIWHRPRQWAVADAVISDAARAPYAPKTWAVTVGLRQLGDAAAFVLLAPADVSAMAVVLGVSIDSEPQQAAGTLI